MVITLILFKLSIKLARKLQARHIQIIDLEYGIFYEDYVGNDDNELFEIKVE